MPRRIRKSAIESLSIRLAPLSPASFNEEDNSVEAVLATDAAVISIDMKSGKPVLEVWRMDGGVFDGQVPMLDTHKRDSVERLKGSIREIRVNGSQLVGRLCPDSTEYEVISKIRNKHITDVSAGVQPLETSEIKAGQTKIVAGQSYTAPAGRSLFVHTKWRLREVSLTPIGSDERAKIRSKGDQTMNESLRKWLEENMKLRAESTPDEAQTFWDALDEKDRQRAEKECEREEDDEDEDEDEDEDKDEKDGKDAKDKKRAKPTFRRRTDKRTVTEESRAADEAERIRMAEFRENTVAVERERVHKIRKAAGSDVPQELVARAIDEGWKLGRARGVFLESVRNRTKSAGGGGNVDESTREFSAQFGIHTRSHETDCTAAALGAALFSRSYRGLRDPCDLIGGYAKTEEGDFVVRADVNRMIEGRAKQANENRRKAAERMLDMGDRYRSISMLELCDEACRIDGKERSSYDPSDRIRAAMSGSALSAIFTTNISAMFLGGYLDAADTTAGWTTESDVPNFLQNERAIFGKMGQLKKLGKGGTAEDLDTSDWNEQYKISRYAGKFIVDEQDIINDRFGAIDQMAPQDMGLTARQIRPNLVYAMLLSNPTLNQDSQAVFCSSVVSPRTIVNTVTGVITDFASTTPTANPGPLQDAVAIMGKQRLRNRVLNLQPRFIIAGTDLSRALNYLYAPSNTAQKVIVSASGYNYNPTPPEISGLNLVYDGRLDPLGCFNNDDGKTYYPWTTTGTAAGRSLTAILSARPGEQGAKTIEIGYLRGSGRAPRIRSAPLPQGMGQYGFAWDVNMDIGAKILDYRGLVLITGGGSQLTATGP